MATVRLENLDAFAKEVLQAIKRPAPTARGAHAHLIFLNGNLGSGKTTFMQAFARALGITETIQSPTFVLMKRYPIDFRQFKHLIHIDAYRLETPKEFATLKPEEFLNDPGNLICIEWAENIASVLPKPDLILNFSSEGMGEGERDINH